MERNRDIHKGLLQPADMLWGVDQLLDKMDDQIELTRQRMESEVSKRSEALQSELEKLNEYYASIWEDDDGR